MTKTTWAKNKVPQLCALLTSWQYMHVSAHSMYCINMDKFQLLSKQSHADHYVGQEVDTIIVLCFHCNFFCVMSYSGQNSHLLLQKL